MSNHNECFPITLKYFFHVPILLLLLFAATTALSANDSLTLADNGESRFDIVAVDDAGSVGQTAIRELSDYLKRISGAQFVVKKQREAKPVIFVGIKDHPSFNGKFVHLQARDSFSIRTQEGPNGRDIYLVGHDSTATAFAVYTFLEDLGCRWFMPGEIGEVVPAAKKLTWTRRERSEQPDFIFRQIWWAYGGPPETAEQFRMWKLHNKVAYPLIQHGHNLTNTLPPKIYFDEHPEYYALVNGERRTTQLCTSNPDVVRLVIERINAYFDEHPEVEAYSLCPDDNTDFCECDACRALDAGGADKYLQGKPVVTDRYIHFLNAVAQGIQDRHPGKKVSTYAYVNYSTPPLREKIDPHVVVVLTSSVYCSAHGIGDLQCASRQAMKQDLAGWTAAAAEVYIYDYDPTPFNAELPWPLFGARRREMGDYLAIGVKGFTFESHNSWATLAPNFYVAAKSMWDAHLDFEALMHDYMQNFFGESAAPMADYYQTLETALAAAPGKVEWGQIAYPTIFTKDVLGRYRRDIDRAVHSAVDKKVRERVRAVALGFEYLENYIQLRNAVADRPTLAEFKTKYNRCLEIIDRLYAMNKDYILHDVAVDYLNRGIGKIATSAYAADLGLVTDWMLIGPFSGGAAGHEHSYPPEQEIDLTAVYTGVNNETVQWREHHNPEYLGKIDLLPLFEPDGRVCAYAMTTVESPTAKEVQFRLGSNDLVKVWLNGEQIWNWDDPSGRLVSLDDDVIPATLPAGKSTILLKISNLGGNWGFCFRITDAEGKRIPELRYALPEAK